MIRLTAQGVSVDIRTARGVFEPDAYAPRFLSALRVPPGARVLDLGCGAGAYGLWAARAGAGEVWLTDIDRAAVRCARANARLNGLRVRSAAGDFFRPCLGHRFDVVVANVPQTPGPRPFSPARWGGRDGSAHLRRLAREAPRHLAPGGRLWFCLISLTNVGRVVSALRKRFDLASRRSFVREFSPRFYEALSPGLWDYLQGLRRRGAVAFWKRRGRYFLRVAFVEARLRDASEIHARSSAARSIPSAAAATSSSPAGSTLGLTLASRKTTRPSGARRRSNRA